MLVLYDKDNVDNMMLGIIRQNFTNLDKNLISFTLQRYGLLLDASKIKTSLAYRSFSHAAHSLWNS